MVDLAYISGRKKWNRPQAIMLSTNSSGIVNGVPQVTGTEGDDFIILSDHNRSEISMKPERIENRKRMVNGHMRSYHIADKLTISTSWSMLPSRSFSASVSFSASGVLEQDDREEYTADGGAGGIDLLRWYENNTGSFYAFLAYDNFESFAEYAEAPTNKLHRYAQQVEVFFSDFSYDIVKRGGSNHDFWNVSLSLEEV